MSSFQPTRAQELPEDLWANHIANTFIEIVIWWLNHTKKESPEILYHYFLSILQISDTCK